jgi:hypothetical protein
MFGGFLKIVAGLSLNIILFLATIWMISEITYILFGERLIKIIF